MVKAGLTAKDIPDQTMSEGPSDGAKGAFNDVDLGDILEKHLEWLQALPRGTASMPPDAVTAEPS